MITVCLHSQGLYTVSLNPYSDSYTYSGNPSSTVGGSSNYLKAYVENSTLYYYRSFLMFDLSAIPSNAIVTSATLNLTPSGTENVAKSGSNELYLDLCNTGWSEFGLSHNSGISNNTLMPSVTISNQIGGIRVFDVTNHVQALVYGRISNYGWMLRRNPENTATLTTNYYSREFVTTSYRPVLQVQYYIPVTIIGASINHATGSSSADGSIVITTQNGSSASLTYQWYNASGTQIGSSQNISGLNPGWYGVKISNLTYGETVYYAFLIVKKCDVTTITFAPDGNYVDDASYSNYSTGSGTTVIKYYESNNGSYSTELTQNWTNGGIWFNQYSLIRFRLWMDPQIQINSANMTLYGNAHYPLSRPNDSQLLLVTSGWEEYGVSYTNVPGTTTSGKILIPGVPTGNTNVTLDIKSFFDTWKSNNTLNNGMLLELQSFTNSYTRMQFYSSDASSGKPQISFNLNYVKDCDFGSYTRFTNTLNGGYTETFQGKLKIQFTEETDQANSKFVKLLLYDAATNDLKAGINGDGTSISGKPLLPSKLIEFDYNQQILDLSPYSLTSGKYYVLELVLLTGEKKYIKFKYQ